MTFDTGYITLNILIIILFFIIIIVTMVYIVDKIIKIMPTIKEGAQIILKYMYLFLIPFPLCYLIFYYQVYDAGNNPKVSIETAQYLEKISIYFFSAGIFSATFKLINSLIVFKKHFKDIIISKEFDDVLTKKLEVLGLSDEYLLQRTDLKEIWSRVTLCKYEQKFPQLKEAIRDKMENDLFHENSLSYYYKNFRTQIIYELIEENIVKITEISNFTIVSNSEELIIMDFWISTDDILNSKEGGIYTKYLAEKCKMDGVVLDIKEVSKDNANNTKIYKTYNAELKGKKEYEIERSIEMTQNLEADRVFSFSSDRIIDNFTIKLSPCDKLNIFFSPVGKNKFNFDNQKHDGQSYVSRDLLLPGEKFQTFIYKKNNIIT